MFKVIILLTHWLFGFSGNRTLPAAFTDTPMITEVSVGKARIGMQIATLKKLYKGSTFTPAYLSSYGFDEWGEEPDAVIVSQNKQKLFVYFATYDTFPDHIEYRKEVAGLIALHPAYRTKQGIHVGSYSSELRTVLPSIQVSPNVLTETNIQDAKVKGSAVTYHFLDQKDLGSQKPGHINSVPLTGKTGRVSWIQVVP